MATVAAKAPAGAAPKAAPRTTKAPAAKADPEPVCEQCWPAGWPANTPSASCIHGKWNRTLPA